MKGNYLTGLLIIISLLLSGCFSLIAPGPAIFVKKAENSSKTKQAILFIKGGNATSGDSWQVSIKDANDKLDETEVGNTFTTDGDHGKVAPDSSSIAFTWQSESKLLITYDKRLRTFIQSNLVDGINVEYKVKAITSRP